MDGAVTCISPSRGEALCSRNEQEYHGLAQIPPWRKETDDIIVGVVWTS